MCDLESMSNNPYWAQSEAKTTKRNSLFDQHSACVQINVFHLTAQSAMTVKIINSSYILCTPPRPTTTLSLQPNLTSLNTRCRSILFAGIVIYRVRCVAGRSECIELEASSRYNTSRQLIAGGVRLRVRSLSGSGQNQVGTNGARRKSFTLHLLHHIAPDLWGVFKC